MGRDTEDVENFCCKSKLTPSSFSCRCCRCLGRKAISECHDTFKLGINEYSPKFFDVVNKV